MKTPPPRRARLIPAQSVFASVLAGALGSACVAPTNPFDPETPPDFQARGVVEGQVRAVFARDEAGQPATAGACDAVDGPVDSAGFRLNLRGIRDDGGAINALSTDTTDNGRFRFEGVPPGPYTLEIVREGFELPPVAEFDVEVGATRDLGAFCAINAKGPPAPVLAPLPALLNDPTASVNVVIADADPACDPATGCAIAWEISQRREGEAALVDVVTADSPTVPLVLAGAAATPSRATITVDVVAVDALDNRSAPTTAAVVIDTLPPPPPTVGQPVVGRDRVTLSFQPRPPADGDDVALSYFVSYSLAPRIDDDDTAANRDDCPFGRPRFDADGEIVDVNGRARFALEGESPIATTATTQTLSGIAPGTDVFLHVAAVDAAGNAGCYGPAVIARPDTVVFAAGLVRSLPAGAAAGGTVRAAVMDGVVDGVVALARGSAGLTIIDAAGVAHVDATPVSDVRVHGRTFVAAAGAPGVHLVPVDDAGVPEASRTVDIGAGVNAVWPGPGVVYAATEDGLRILDLDDDTVVAVDDDLGRGSLITRFGPTLLLARAGENGGAFLQAIDAGSRSEVARFALPQLPDDLLVHDGALVVALGGVGVAIHELDGCAADDVQARARCLTQRVRRGLPRNGNARRLAAFDEQVVLLADDDAGRLLLALDPRQALDIVGRATVNDDGDDGDDDGALLTDAGLVCHFGGEVLAACQRSFSGPLVDRSRRLVLAGEVKRTVVGGGEVVAFEEAGAAGSVGAVVRASLATMGVVQRATIAGRPADPRLIDPLGGVRLDDGRVLVVDGTARIFVADVSNAADAAETGATLVEDLGADLATIAPGLLDPLNVDNGTMTGFVALDGSDLLVSLVDQAGTAALLRVSLHDAGAGLTVNDVTAMSLPSVEQTTNLVLRGGRAYVPTAPFGLVVVELSSLTMLTDEGRPVGTGGSADDVAFVALDGVTTTGLLMGVREDDVSGLFDLTGSTGIASPAFVGAANALVGLYDVGVVTSRLDGAVSVLADVPGGDVALVAGLTIPEASQGEDTRPSVRGIVVADSAGGVVRVVFR